MTHAESRGAFRRVMTVVVVAILVLLAADFGVRARASRLPPHQTWSSPEMQFKTRQIAALQKHGGASVVFLGSSAVDASVDASHFVDPNDPRPAYNAALGGGSARMITTWATAEVIPRLKPDIVVLGLTSREVNPNNSGENSLERNFFAAPAVKHAVGTESLLETAERHLESWSALFKYRTQLRQPQYLEAFVGFGHAPGPDAYSFFVAPSGQYKAFLHSPYQFTTAVRNLFANQGLYHFAVGQQQLADVRNFVSSLTRAGTRVILVNMPVTQDFVDLHPNGRADYDKVPAALSQVAARTGASFLDPGVWPRLIFADPGHMNLSGSTRFTALLQSRVDTLG